MRLINLTEGDCGMVQQAAELLVEGFRENWPKAWPNIVAAREEVRQAFDSSRICRVAVDERIKPWVGWEDFRFTTARSGSCIRLSCGEPASNEELAGFS